MFEIFLWKSSAIVRLQVYEFFPQKTAGLFTGVFYIFAAFILGLKCHKTNFEEKLWVAASNVSCIYFSFLFEYFK